jgi:hypothetical protein
MQIIEIPKNLLTNKILVDQYDFSSHTNFLYKNDSYLYFKSIKNKLLDKELLLNKIDKCVFSPYTNLTSIYKEKYNFTIYDLELIEVLTGVGWFNANVIFNYLFICNFSSSTFFKSKYYFERRNKTDIIENADLSLFNLKNLFSNLTFIKKEIINLFNLDISFLPISKKRNLLLFNLIQYISIYSANGGWFILKMKEISNDTFLQEFIYLLSGWYSNCYLVKSSFVFNQEPNLFFICKNFKLSLKIKHNLIEQFQNLNNICIEEGEFKWNKLLADPLSKVFVNSIKEVKVINGQISLTYDDLIIYILKNKNKEEKINLYLDNNKVKCNFWEQTYIKINEIVDDINENSFVSMI